MCVSQTVSWICRHKRGSVVMHHCSTARKPDHVVKPINWELQRLCNDCLLNPKSYVVESQDSKLEFIPRDWAQGYPGPIWSQRISKNLLSICDANRIKKLKNSLPPESESPTTDVDDTWKLLSGDDWLELKLLVQGIEVAIVLYMVEQVAATLATGRSLSLVIVPTEFQFILRILSDIYNYNLSGPGYAQFLRQDERRRKRESKQPPLPQLLEEMMLLDDVPSDEKDCGICLNEIGTGQEGSVAEYPARTPCGHTLGNICITEWVLANANCPICRQVFSRSTHDFPEVDIPTPEWFKVLMENNSLEWSLLWIPTLDGSFRDVPRGNK